MQIGDPILLGEHFAPFGESSGMARLELGDNEYDLVFCRRVGTPRDGAVEPADHTPPKGDAPAGLQAALAQANDDMRTMEAAFDAHEMRFKDFRTAVTMLVEDSLWDWPLDVSRTVLWTLKCIAKGSRNMTAWLDAYFTRKRYADTDRARYELRAIAETMQYLITYDQVNVASLAGVERIMRR